MSTSRVELTLPKLHPAQEQIVREARRFNTCCLGRRAGKTVLGQDRLIRPALKGLPVAWFAPTYRLLSEAWRSLQTTLYPVTAAINQTEHRLELVGGGVIECWSLDSPDAGRGRAYAAVVVDEAALVADLQRAWEQSIRPMLSDHRGSGWFLSTPRGINNYFHVLYQKGQGMFRGEWRSWQMPSSCNPHLPAEEIEAMKADMTEMSFQQEIEARFVSWEGQVFRRIMDCVMAGPAQGKVIVIACDWAKASDFTVFAALTDRGELAGIDRFRQLDYVQQHNRLRAFWERHGQPVIWSEKNSMGGAINDFLRNDGLPVVDWDTNSASKQQMIGALQMAFEQGSISIPNDPTLIAELQSFEGTPTASGMMRYSAPAGLHDDLVIALAIAWAALGAARKKKPAIPFGYFDNSDMGGWSAMKFGMADDPSLLYGTPTDAEHRGTVIDERGRRTRMQ